MENRCDGTLMSHTVSEIRAAAHPENRENRLVRSNRPVFCISEKDTKRGEEHVAQPYPAVKMLSRHKNQCAHWYLFHGHLDSRLRQHSIYDKQSVAALC